MTTRAALEMAGAILSRDLVDLQTRVTQLSMLIRKAQGSLLSLQALARQGPIENTIRTGGGVDETV